MHTHQNDVVAKVRSNRNSGSLLGGFRVAYLLLWEWCVGPLPHLLPHTPTLLLLLTHRSQKPKVHTKTRMQSFIAALRTIAQCWKPPGCSSVDEWINYGTFRQRNII